MVFPLFSSGRIVENGRCGNRGLHRGIERQGVERLPEMVVGVLFEPWLSNIPMFRKNANICRPIIHRKRHSIPVDAINRDPFNGPKSS